MPRKDPIIEEIQAVREEIAREAGCDIERILEEHGRRPAVGRRCGCPRGGSIYQHSILRVADQGEGPGDWGEWPAGGKAAGVGGRVLAQCGWRGGAGLGRPP
jgi:G-patch domain